MSASKCNCIKEAQQDLLAFLMIEKNKRVIEHQIEEPSEYMNLCINYRAILNNGKKSIPRIFTNTLHFKYCPFCGEAYNLTEDDDLPF